METMRILCIWMLCVASFLLASCDEESDAQLYMLENNTAKTLSFEVGACRGELPIAIEPGAMAQLTPRYFCMGRSVGLEKKKLFGKQPYLIPMPSELEIVKYYYNDSVYVDANTGYGDRYTVFRLESWWNDRVLPGGIIEKHHWSDDVHVFSIDEAYLSTLPAFPLSDSASVKSYVQRVAGRAE